MGAASSLESHSLSNAPHISLTRYRSGVIMDDPPLLRAHCSASRS